LEIIAAGRGSESLLIPLALTELPLLPLQADKRSAKNSPKNNVAELLNIRTAFNQYDNNELCTNYDELHRLEIAEL
jgi:hypothetical protein